MRERLQFFIMIRKVTSAHASIVLGHIMTCLLSCLLSCQARMAGHSTNFNEFLCAAVPDAHCDSQR